MTATSDPERNFLTEAFAILDGTTMMQAQLAHLQALQGYYQTLLGSAERDCMELHLGLTIQQCEQAVDKVVGQ